MPFPTTSRRAFFPLLAGIGLFAGAARAASIPDPTDKPILTISGKIKVTNKDGTAQFDRAMLESLGLKTIETTTPWFKGSVRFEGVSLDKLMKQVGAAGDRVTAVALNNYTVEIPTDDFVKYDVILALKRDGEYMAVIDKGPLFVVYPYDRHPDLKSAKYYARSAWQVAQLIVK